MATKNKSAKIIYGGFGGVTITGRISIPKELVALLPDVYTDNLTCRFDSNVDKYARTYSNQFGSFKPAFGPSPKYPLGRNATFIAVLDGAKYEAEHWGYVVEDATNGKYVPGWCASARLLGHPDKCAPMNLWYRKPQKQWYDALPVGTDVRPILRNAGYGV